MVSVCYGSFYYYIHERIKYHYQSPKLIVHIVGWGKATIILLLVYFCLVFFSMGIFSW